MCLGHIIRANCHQRPDVFKLAGNAERPLQDRRPKSHEILMFVTKKMPRNAAFESAKRDHEFMSQDLDHEARSCWPFWPTNRTGTTEHCNVISLFGVLSDTNNKITWDLGAHRTCSETIWGEGQQQRQLNCGDLQELQKLTQFGPSCDKRQ